MSARAVLGWSALLLGAGLANGATAACGSGATDDPGLQAYLRMPGAQFVKGTMPSGASTGPSVSSVNLVTTTIYPNFPNDSLTGALAPTATAAAIGLQGDVGYWLVVAGVPDVATPKNPSYAGTMAFSGGIVAGNYTLVVHAIDASGSFGPASTLALEATGAPPTEPVPTGDLVVTLAWSNDANLDLHVVDPDGTDLYWGAQSTQPPFSFQQSDGGSYGTIDYDSNANCVLDGIDREDAVWKSAPPSGQYTVRVDTAALCGQPDAYWTVTVVLAGKTIGQAQGVALDADTRGSHGAGSGVTALTFQVP
jgi:hypothetical protein